MTVVWSWPEVVVLVIWTEWWWCGIMVLGSGGCVVVMWVLGVG